MALVVGQCKVEPVTGLAGRAYTAWTTNPESGLLAAALTEGTDARNTVAALVEAIAQAVVDEIEANALTQIGGEHIV